LKLALEPKASPSDTPLLKGKNAENKIPVGARGIEKMGDGKLPMKDQLWKKRPFFKQGTNPNQKTKNTTRRCYAWTEGERTRGVRNA